MQERDEEHFVGLVAQKAIIEQGGKIFMVRNINEERWDFPGGRLNANELPETGLVRELAEEIGCECVVGSMVYANQYWHGGAQKPCLFLNYEVTMQGEVTIATDELSEAAWIDPHDLTEALTFPNCLDALKARHK